MRKRMFALLMAGILPLSMPVTSFAQEGQDTENTQTAQEEAASYEATTQEERESIEELLNLKNNVDVTWTYASSSDSWTMSVVSAVAYPEIEDQQGVSVCVPGAYVRGIDTDGDGTEDVTSQDGDVTAAGSLVIDYEAEIVSTNGVTYTAATAPVILNTGAAGYGSSRSTTASSSYAAEGYINVSCGNRGKQDTATDESGNTYYTGDAPSCLVDQKNAARFVKYNILLGNLPGNTEAFVSTGGSGGGAHAAMFAATSNNSDFYDYEIEAGAVGVYRNEDGTYSTTVTINGEATEISDGAWGCIAYSAITSLAEADMAMAFEYYMDTTYDFGSDFQAQLAEYLSEAYMEYINEQGLAVDEAAVGFDLNGDGDAEDRVELTIECDPEAYPETNGYYGTYLNLYLAEFQENLQWYLDNLDYAEGWTWFDEDGSALSDEEVAAMTTEDKAEAFLEGRYAKGSSGSMGGPGGMQGGPDGMRGDRGGMQGGPGEIQGMPEGMQGGPGEMQGMPEGMSEAADGMQGMPEGMLEEMSEEAGGMQGMPEGMSEEAGGMQSMPEEMTEEDASAEERSFANEDVAANSAGDTMDVGTPDAGTTQAAGSRTDSGNYASYAEMVEAYASDIAEIEAGDEYGNNIVSLYDPLNYIGAEDTDDPTWARILMGASEGDMSMFSSLNLQIAFLNAGVDAEIEWQWDGGHVPSEIFSESFALYVDQMYSRYFGDGTEIEAAPAEAQTENGTAESMSGTDLSDWVNYEDISAVSFSLADAAAYRTAGASKSIPGFDVIDYGQEDYVFGSSEQDARHWNRTLLEIFGEHADVLENLFNNSAS